MRCAFAGRLLDAVAAGVFVDVDGVLVAMEVSPTTSGDLTIDRVDCFGHRAERGR